MSIASQLSFSTATSVRGGALGSIPYQSATSATVFVSIGSAGTVLTSNGTAPIWAPASGTTVGTSTQVTTISRAFNGEHHLAFVDSNNASATAEAVYTTSSFTINPFTGNIQIGMIYNDYQPASGGNHTLRLNAVNTSSIGFHDSGSTIANIKFSGAYGFEIGAFDGLYGPHNTILHGNVGVGTISPQTKFVVSNAGANGLEVNPNGGVGSGALLQSYNRSGATYTQMSYYASAHTFNVGAGGGARAVDIDASGNVGVGTASPTYRLTVSTSTNSATTTASSIALHLFNPAGDGNISQPNRTGIGFGASTTRSAIVAGTFGNDYLDFYTNGDITTPRIRIRSTGAIAFSGTNTHGTAGQFLQSNGDAAPTWVAANVTTVGTSTQVNTVLQTANASYFPTFVDSNNATSTAEAVYTTSTFTINPMTGFVGIGSQDGASPLNVRALSTLSGTINSFQRIFTTQASGGNSNNVYRSEWRRRRAAGTDWTTQNIHDGIWVDASFITPGTDTRTWWERDPNSGTHAWGHAATTYSFIDASSNMFLTGGSSQLNTGFTNKLNVGGAIVAGTISSPNGSIILQGQYGTGAITNFGTEYSSGGPVLGYGVYPSNTATGAFFSSSGLALTRGAYTIAGNAHNWYVGAAQTLPIGSTATVTLAMTLNASGALAFNGATNYGTAGQVLQSNGNAPPTWVPVSGTTVGTSTQVTTIAQTANASHFLTFVDSNNASATAEAVYTTSTVVVNPQSSNVGIGTSSPSTRLTIEGTAAAPATVTLLTLRNSSDGGIGMSFTNAVSVPLASINALVTSSGAGTDDGILAFSTAVNGVITERFRADASGSLILNGTVGGTGNAIVLRGGTAASSEGPQIIMGYGNNTSSAITGQANSTWNIDIASGLANNNFRIFRQNSAGATVVGAEFTEASGGVQLVSVGVGTTSSGVTGEIRATNEITAYFSSDIRLKENIRLITDPVTIVNQIRGVYYDWTDEHIKARGGEDGYFVRKHDIGVIAQEVEKVLPEIVATRDDGTKVVKYEKLVALLIEAVKDQQRQINQISQALENLAIK